MGKKTNISFTIIVCVIPVHPEKAQSPILVTELGIVTEVRPLQPSKADSPILVTELGIVTEVRPVQSSFVAHIDNQRVAYNTVEKWIGCYLWVYGK